MKEGILDSEKDDSSRMETAHISNTSSICSFLSGPPRPIAIEFYYHSRCYGLFFSALESILENPSPGLVRNVNECE